MKIAIIYSSIGGTTGECADLLARELKNHEVEIFEIGKREPTLTDFDVAVIGFPIVMGKAEKSARKYMKTHREELASMRAAYYICCGFIDCFEDYASRCLPQNLREKAVDISCLGGSLDPSRFKGLNKMIVKSVRADILGGGDNGDERKDAVLPTVLEENISQFAEKIKQSAEA